MRTQFRSLAAVLLAACLFSGLLIAQEIFATLIGTVTDSTGAVIPNANVTVHNNETNTDVRTIATDGSGNFTVTNLPAGNYTVTVKATGFQTYTASNVVLNVAQKRPLDVQLKPGQVTENITVSETANPVQTSSAAQMGTVTGTQVRELELNNRNFEQLLTLQTGVASQLPDVVGFGLANTTYGVGQRRTLHRQQLDRRRIGRKR